MSTEVIPTPDKDADFEAAKTIRENIETLAAAGQVIVLGKGDFPLDRAIWGRTDKPLIIVGQGEETRVWNKFTPTPYMMNQAVSSHGLGVGWNDRFQLRKGSKAIILDPQAAVAEYKPGRVVYLAGMDIAFAMHCLRRTVAAVNVETRTVAFTEPVAFDPNQSVQQYYAKWTDGEAVADVIPGSVSVELENAPIEPFEVGQQVLISCGPSKSGFEFPSEWRKVERVEGKTVILDYPLHRGYTFASIVRVKPALVRLENLTLSPNPFEYRADPLCCKFSQVELRNVRTHGISLASCGPSTIDDCRLRWFVSNTCDRLRIAGGYYAYVAVEEANIGLEFDRISVGPGMPNGFYTSTLDNEFIKLTNSRVGVWPPHETTGLPMAWGGKDFLIRDLEIFADSRDSYLFGDGLRVENLKSNGRVIFKEGHNMFLSGIQTPNVQLGWIEDSGSSGILFGPAVGDVIIHNPKKWTVYGMVIQKGS